MLRASTIIFLFFLSTFPVFSQNTTFSIRGKVIDAETKATLKNVSIRINGTLSGTISDSAGVFHIEGQGVAVILNFSMLGYEKKSVKVSEQIKDTLIVELVQKQNNLSEVNINASGVEVVNKSKRYNVLDYDFYDSNILLITYVDLNKAKLVLINRNSDTLGFKKIPYEPNRLFKDCIGNIHVVCRDSLYQVYYNGKTLSLLSGKSTRDFEDILLPCVAQDSSNYFMINKYGSKLINADGFHSFHSHNLGLNYVFANKKTRQKQLLVTIEDEKGMVISNDEDAFEARKRASGLSTEGDKTFTEAILLKEIYAPLYNIHNRIYIFDFVNSKIRPYNRQHVSEQEVPIEFHKSLKFIRDMQIDEKTSKVFALFESNGIIELQDVNLITGLINASYKIPFVFVNHVKVYDNYIYFIRKENGYDEVRFLSRLRIN